MTSYCHFLPPIRQINKSSFVDLTFQLHTTRLLHRKSQHWIRKIVEWGNNGLHSSGNMTRSQKVQSPGVEQCPYYVSAELSRTHQHTSCHHGSHQTHDKLSPPHCQSEKHHTPGIPNQQYIRKERWKIFFRSGRHLHGFLTRTLFHNY